jgi:hypothetical protein
VSLLSPTQTLVFRLARLVVPAGERVEWQREWDGELAALASRVASWPLQRRRLARVVVQVAVRDACWLRLHPPSAWPSGRSTGEPSRCTAPLTSPTNGFSPRCGETSASV